MKSLVAYLHAPTPRELLLSALVVTVSCSSGTQSSSAPEPTRGLDVLSVEELSDVDELTLLQAIQRLRPFWLSRRGVGAARDRPILVYFNDVLAGGVEYLEQIEIELVQEVRFHDPENVYMRWGRANTAGAIEVIRKTSSKT